MNSVAEHLVATLRACAHAYVAGDQVPPCAVLWLDPDRLWESVVPDLLPHLPELFVMGAYAMRLAATLRRIHTLRCVVCSGRRSAVFTRR